MKDSGLGNRASNDDNRPTPADRKEPMDIGPRRWMCAALAVVLLFSLVGCATTAVGPRRQTDTIRAAYLSGDKAYLLGEKRDYEIDPKPFVAYHALLDSPLKEAVVCSRLSGRIWLGTGRPSPMVVGTYGLLLDPARVDPAAAAAAGLRRVESNDSYLYKLAVDPRCAPAASAVGYYVATFQGEGRLVTVEAREQRLAEAALAQPVTLELDVKGSEPLGSPAAESVSAVVTAPFYLFGILFFKKSL
ncbi:hypothetical protein [Stenotrophomonas sp. 24(2023)]|uniref:hypothetical protein n=1 Tax=Stenotrophomonas sp. 24(2023) TaxID=3068324 RepID=UPI0027E1645F|nr:hypothetical protein [Stenotrophomonas sp. 24(2023)]WMJ70133.1 hypothetical protein Q9R17_03220 [Stenotrophomonas sp. 24(2023)]